MKHKKRSNTINTLWQNQWKTNMTPYPNLTVSLGKREKSKHTTIDILRPLNAQKTTNNVEHITMFESS